MNGFAYSHYTLRAKKIVPRCLLQGQAVFMDSGTQLKSGTCEAKECALWADGRQSGTCHSVLNWTD
jgi:hypothetical protein